MIIEINVYYFISLENNIKNTYEIKIKINAALPEDDPEIRGIARSYAIGDFVMANCTSDKSSPAPDLIWTINNEKVT